MYEHSENTKQLLDHYRGLKEVIHSSIQQDIQVSRKQFDGRRYQTMYWIDARKGKPISNGFCASRMSAEVNATKALALYYVGKVQVFDRLKGEVITTWKRNAEGSLIKHKGDVR